MTNLKKTLILALVGFTAISCQRLSCTRTQENQPHHDAPRQVDVSGVPIKDAGELLESSTHDESLAHLGEGLPLNAIRRLGSNSFGNETPVYSLVFSPGGTRVAALFWNSLVRVWEFPSGRILDEFKPDSAAEFDYENEFRNLVFKASEDVLGVSSRNGGIYLRNIKERAHLQTLKRKVDKCRGACPLAISSSGEFVAYVAAKGVSVWDVKNSKLIRFVTTQNPPTSVAFSPQSDEIMIGELDGVIESWLINPGDDIARAQNSFGPLNHIVRGPVGHIDYSRDGKFVVVSILLFPDSIDGKHQITALLDGRTKKPLRIWEKQGNFAISPDSKLLATTHYNTITLWDTATSKQVKKLSDQPYAVYAIEFSPDGRVLAISGSERVIKFWDLESERFVNAPVNAHSSHVTAVDFSPDGSRVVTGSLDRTIRIWDVDSGENVYGAEQFQSGVKDVVYTPDGQRLVVITENGLQLLAADDGKALCTFEDPPRMSRGPIVFSANGKYLTMGYGSFRVWSATTCELVTKQWKGGGFPEKTRWFEGEREISAIVDDGREIHSWDIATGEFTGKKEVKFDLSETGAVAGDGRTMATLGVITVSRRETVFLMDRIHIWDNQTGKIVKTLVGSESTVGRRVAISPDGKYVATGAGSEGNYLFIWDVELGKPIHEMRGHASSINEVEFSPDGCKLATASDDSTVLIWNMPTPDCPPQ